MRHELIEVAGRSVEVSNTGKLLYSSPGYTNGPSSGGSSRAPTTSATSAGASR